MTQHRFPVGAWVTDPFHHRLTNGGLVSDMHGKVHFDPSSGEIVAAYDKPWPAYKVVFGGSWNVIFAEGAVCYQCQAKADNQHHEYCPLTPDGSLRSTCHEPGYAP